MQFDFSGYVTKKGVCTDGKTIMPGAFKSNHGKKVPMVWGHDTSKPGNILGDMYLEHRDDGMYGYGVFNKETEDSQNAAILVKHGNINKMSIHAVRLKQDKGKVMDGEIKEVSLVVSGANPGAVIDCPVIQHSDGSYDEVNDEAIIYTADNVTFSLTDLEFKHGDEADEEPASEEVKPADEAKHADQPTAANMTAEEIIASMTTEQKTLMAGVVGEIFAKYAAPGDSMTQADNPSDYLKHIQGGKEMGATHNIFETGGQPAKPHLTRDQIKTIVEDGKRLGSLKDSFLIHADDYGIDNIEVLFPDARAITATPEFIQRETAWVNDFLTSTHHTPFSRIKTITADITADEARAKGYIKGNKKLEEVFPLLKRVTNPTTIYKKQKLDRDDLIDITELDVVVWLKAEMMLMYREELARAALIGDGRDAASPDKIDETCIRPVYKDDDLFTVRVPAIASDATPEDMIDAAIRNRRLYKGSGTPNFYTTSEVLADMLLIKDSLGRRIYDTEASLAAVLRVNRIIEVDVMDGVSRVTEETTPRTLNLMGIMLNPQDYNFGSDRGGELTMFDDFDLDYNQQKYLLEGRCSGALVKPYSAMVFEKVAAAG